MAAETFAARDVDEVRRVLEMVVAGCRAELDAAASSPLSGVNRVNRRARRRR